MLFVCATCPGRPCELNAPEADGPPGGPCPFSVDADPRWREVPSGRSTVEPPVPSLLPGPFCEIPASAIARATAEAGRYAIEIGGVDRLEIPVSRAAFDEAVRAMEAVCRAAVE